MWSFVTDFETGNALVPLSGGVHAGHVELIRAAKSLLGAYVFVTYSGEEVPPAAESKGHDMVECAAHGVGPRH